jgi:acetylornithine deacetylase
VAKGNIAEALGWIDAHRENIISDFKEFLRIPSLTGEEGKGQEFMIAGMRSLGLEMDIWEPDIQELFTKFPDIAQYPTSWQPELDLVLKFKDICTYEQLAGSEYADRLTYRGRPNAVGVRKGTGGGRSLILNGHVDVVTVGDRTRWDHDPFGAEQVGDTIYGRGASDMKGGLIAMLKALEAVIRSGVPLKGDVILQSVVNEEHAGNGSLSCAARGYRADAAICAEPSGARRYSAFSGGGVYWEIVIPGKEAHTGSRWKDGRQNGVSAIEKSAPIITALLAQEAKANAEQIKLSLGIGVIKGGTYATATARDCVISGVVYFSPDLGTGPAGIRRVKTMFKEAIDEACAGDPWLSRNRAEVLYLHYDDAYRYPENAGFLEVLRQSGKEALHADLAESAFSACDARQLGNQAGVPTIIYGPGELSMAHSVNECITEGEILEATKVIAATICNWCG